MIELKKAVLPETVNVSGKLYRIHTSFKYWLRFLELVEKNDKNPYVFDFLYVDKTPADRIEGFSALLGFSTPPSLLPRLTSSDTGEKVVDYQIDAEYIYAAFYEQYGIDLIEADMHWYKFQALFRGLHDTKLNEIIGFRLFTPPNGKKSEYDRDMEKLKRAWALPEKDEGKEDAALMRFEALLYGEATAQKNYKERENG